MDMNLTLHGSPSAHPPLIMAHGLYGSGRNLGGLARRLAQDRQVICVDLRNHGDSGWDADHSYAALADDLADLIDAQGGTADLFGHSMGGKAAMMLALTRPKALRRLIVADIAPVGYAHDQTGLIDAMEAMDLTGLTRRSEADQRLAQTIPDPGVRAFLLQSLDLTGAAARWKFNLTALRAQMDQITGWPEINGQFDGATLFLDGTASDYIQPAHHDQIHALFPQARITPIEAGHWVHAERPAEVGAAIEAHLS